MFSYFRAQNIQTPFDQEKLQTIHLYIIQFESDKVFFNEYNVCNIVSKAFYKYYNVYNCTFEEAPR